MYLMRRRQLANLRWLAAIPCLGSALIALGVLWFGLALSLGMPQQRQPATTAILVRQPARPFADAIEHPDVQVQTQIIAPPDPAPNRPAEERELPQTSASVNDRTPTATAIVESVHHAITQLAIPAIGITAPVVDVGYQVVEVDGQRVLQWDVADYAAGHHKLSAIPGQSGNIVISGHSDWKGEVFRTLERVTIGDDVILMTTNGQHRYVVAEIQFRKEDGVAAGERLAIGQFIAPMDEERVTLVTCWPYGVDDHRLIVVAKPESER